jgi:hypothetical protein
MPCTRLEIGLVSFVLSLGPKAELVCLPQLVKCFLKSISQRFLSETIGFELHLTLYPVVYEFQLQ